MAQIGSITIVYDGQAVQAVARWAANARDIGITPMVHSHTAMLGEHVGTHVGAVLVNGVIERMSRALEAAIEGDWQESEPLF